MALTQLKTGAIADDAVTTDKLANAINTERTANTAKVSLDADSVTGAKIADDAVGAEHIEVLDAALQFGDSVKAQFGAGNDLELYHDGTDTHIDNATSNLRIKSNDVQLRDTAENFYIDCNNGGSVDLYHNGSKKFETTSSGVSVTGGQTITSYGGTTGLGQLNFGASGTPNIKAWDTGNHGSGSKLQIRSGDGDTHIECNRDGNVELYYDNSKRLETDANGIHVTTNVHLPDNGVLELGDGSDLQIYHDGTTNIIEGLDGNMSIRPKTGENGILLRNNSSVDLYYNDAKKFETTSDGALVSGRLAIGASAANNKINVLGAAGDNQTTLYYGFGTIDLTSASDERVKNNIVPTTKGLDDILKLPVIDFTYKPEYAADSKTVRTGGIAQEWRKVDPNLVNSENEDLLFIEYKRAIPHLIKAVQELSAEINKLKAA